MFLFGATLVLAPLVVYLLISGKTIGGICLFLYCAGVVGTVDNFLRPILAALFMTVLAIYSREFADWLELDDPTAGSSPDSGSDQLATTQDIGG